MFYGQTNVNQRIGSLTGCPASTSGVSRKQSSPVDEESRHDGYALKACVFTCFPLRAPLTTMSLVDFQTKYSSFVEGMVRSAISETTKLFETIIDELKEELSKVKKENDEIKTRCQQVEVENEQLKVSRLEKATVCVQTDALETRDQAAQCDLVHPSIVEQPQPLVVNQQKNSSNANACQNEQLQRESTGEEALMTDTFVVKEEDSEPVLVSKHLIRNAEDDVPFYVLSVEHCQPFKNSEQPRQQYGVDEPMYFLQDHQYCGEAYSPSKHVKQEEDCRSLPVPQESVHVDTGPGYHTDRECMANEGRVASSTTIQEIIDLDPETEMDPDGPRVVSFESLSPKYTMNKKRYIVKKCIKPTCEGESLSKTSHLNVSSGDTLVTTSSSVVEHNGVPLQDAMLLVEAMNQQSSLSGQAVESETFRCTASEVKSMPPAEVPKSSLKNNESYESQPVILNAKPIQNKIIKIRFDANPSMPKWAKVAKERELDRPPSEEATDTNTAQNTCTQKVLVVPKCLETQKTLQCTDKETNDEASSQATPCTGEGQANITSPKTPSTPRKAYLVSRLCREQVKEVSTRSTKGSNFAKMQPVVVIRIPRLQASTADSGLWKINTTGLSSSRTSSEETGSPGRLSLSMSEDSEMTPSSITAPLSEELLDEMEDIDEPLVAAEPHHQMGSTELEESHNLTCGFNPPVKEEEDEEEQIAEINLAPISHKDLHVPQLHMTKTQFLANLAVGPSSQPDEEHPVEASTPETGRKRKLQNSAFVAKLRSHIKSHLQERRIKTSPDVATETEDLPVSPKKARLESDDVKEVSNATEPDGAKKMAKEGASSKSTTSRHLKNKSPAVKFTWRTLTLSQNAGDTEEDEKISIEKSPPVSVGKVSKDGSQKGTAVPKKPSLVKSPTSSQCAPKLDATPLSRCSSSKENAIPKKSTVANMAKRSRKDKSPQKIKQFCTQSESPDVSTDVTVKAKMEPVTLRRTTNRTDRDDHLAQMTKPTLLSFKKPRSYNSSTKTGSSVTHLTNSETSAGGFTNVSTKKVSFSDGASKTFVLGKTTDFEDLKTNGVLWTKLTNNDEAVKKANKKKSKVSLKVDVARKLTKAAKTGDKKKCSDKSKLHREGKTRTSRQTHKKNKSAEAWTPPKNARSERKSLERATTRATTRTPPQDKTTSPEDKGDKTSEAVVSGSSPSSGSRFQCMECGRVLCSKISLQSHANLHIGQRPFSCTVCSKTFLDSRGLKRHERVHHNNRTYVCIECGKGFVYQFGLTKHIKMVHTRFKPFVCQICNKAFFTKQEVEAHIRRHTGEKPFPCDQCDKRFAKKVELIVHMRWHNGEKRHWCPYCGKGFLDYNNLKRHKYIHTGERPHVCQYCQKRFIQSSHVKKHIRNVHKMPINV